MGNETPPWMNAAWYVFHYLYPLGKKWTYQMLDILPVAQPLLPCGICREHFGKLLKNTMSGPVVGMDMGYYMFEKHNAVNKNANHPQYSVVKFELEYNTRYNNRQLFNKNLDLLISTMKYRIDNNTEGTEKTMLTCNLKKFESFISKNRAILGK